MVDVIRSFSDRDVKEIVTNSVVSLDTEPPLRMDIPKVGRIAPDSLELKGQIKKTKVLSETTNGLLFVLPRRFGDVQDVDPKDRVSDLLLSAPGSEKRTHTLRGVHLLGDERVCSIKSRWFDAERRVERTTDGIRIVQTLTHKQHAIRAKDLRGNDFAEVQRQVKSCFGELGLAVTTDRSLRQVAFSLVQSIWD